MLSGIKLTFAKGAPLAVCPYCFRKMHMYLDHITPENTRVWCPHCDVSEPIRYKEVMDQILQDQKKLGLEQAKKLRGN